MVNRMGPKFKDLVQRVTRFNPLPEYDDPNCESWRLMKAILRQWDSELEHPAIVFPIPLYQCVEETVSPRGVQARFAELSDLQHTTVYDPLADLRAYPATQRRGFRFATDAHPTPEGHRALAESLANPIRAIIETQANTVKS
jgi:carbamoyltransferase